MRSRWASGVLVVLGLWAGVLHATLVTRPNKTCGTTNYASEVTAGCTTIKSSELDGDINALVGGVNDITTANIDPAGLGAAAIASGAVTFGKLASNSVGTANIIAGSTVSGFASGTVTANLNSNGTTEVTYVTLGAITTRGGQVIIGGTIAGTVGHPDAGNHTVTFRLYRDATLTKSWTAAFHTTSASEIFPIFMPVIWSEVPSVGAHTYSVRVVMDSANPTFSSSATNPGTVFAVELA